MQRQHDVLRHHFALGIHQRAGRVLRLAHDGGEAGTEQRVLHLLHDTGEACLDDFKIDGVDDHGAHCAIRKFFSLTSFAHFGMSAAESGAQVGGRAAALHHRHTCQFLLHILTRQNFLHAIFDFLLYGFRRASRREHAYPDLHVITGQSGFVRRWHVRVAFDPFQRRHRKRRRPARRQSRSSRGDVGDAKLRLAGHDGRHGRRRAAVLHTGDIDLGHALEQFEIEERCRTAGRVIELAGILSGEIEHFPQCRERRFRARHDDFGDRHHHGDRREIFLRSVLQVAVKRRIHRHGTVVRNKQRVAVGRGFGDFLDAKPHRSARPVLGSDRLAPPGRKLGRHQPGQRVDAAPCRGWDDDAYRMIRIGLCPRARHPP